MASNQPIKSHPSLQIIQSEKLWKIQYCAQSANQIADTPPQSSNQKALSHLKWRPKISTENSEQESA